MVKKTTGAIGTGTAVALTAAAAAAAAGAYWLYGAQDASKNRKAVKSWMLKARAEVMDAVEKVTELDKETYLKIVDDVVKGYSKVSGVQSAEVEQLISDLKKSWKYMRGQKTAATRRTKAVKKSVKRVIAKAKKGAKKMQ